MAASDSLSEGASSEHLYSGEDDMSVENNSNQKEEWIDLAPIRSETVRNSGAVSNKYSNSGKNIAIGVALTLFLGLTLLLLRNFSPNLLKRNAAESVIELEEGFIGEGVFMGVEDEVFLEEVTQTTSRSKNTAASTPEAPKLFPLDTRINLALASVKNAEEKMGSSLFFEEGLQFEDTLDAATKNVNREFRYFSKKVQQHVATTTEELEKVKGNPELTDLLQRKLKILSEIVEFGTMSENLANAITRLTAGTNARLNLFLENTFPQIKKDNIPEMFKDNPETLHSLQTTTKKMLQHESKFKKISEQFKQLSSNIAHAFVASGKMKDNIEEIMPKLPNTNALRQNIMPILTEMNSYLPYFKSMSVKVFIAESSRYVNELVELSEKSERSVRKMLELQKERIPQYFALERQWSLLESEYYHLEQKKHK